MLGLIFLVARFMSKHMDSDLQHLIETSAPPVQLESLSNFRSLLFKFKRQAGCSSFFFESNLSLLVFEQAQEKSEKEEQELLGVTLSVLTVKMGYYFQYLRDTLDAAVMLYSNI